MRIREGGRELKGREGERGEKNGKWEWKGERRRER